MGRESAIQAGCNPNKVVDFPYVVDAERLEQSNPDSIPKTCLRDVASKKMVVLFSGRHIHRKGLPTLLEAAEKLQPVNGWVLWIEGDGPLRTQYQELASRLGISEQCRFLGFCQMDLHGWLVAHAHIVVVPSLHDPWGIVVDEGMQLGKAVCASRSTGSALDRISDGENGFLFTAADSQQLRELLQNLISNRKLVNSIGFRARLTAQQWSPRRNAEELAHVLSLH
ncbi:MAG: glycosyltransferase [Pseudomonadota bacterium]